MFISFFIIIFFKDISCWGGGLIWSYICQLDPFKKINSPTAKMEFGPIQFLDQPTMRQTIKLDLKTYDMSLGPYGFGKGGP